MLVPNPDGLGEEIRGVVIFRLGDDEGVGDGVGEGVGDGVGEDVGDGVADGVGDGVADGVLEGVGGVFLGVVRRPVGFAVGEVRSMKKNILLV